MKPSIALAVFGLWAVLWPHSAARAHPSAISRALAQAEGDRVDVAYKLDATSIADLVGRQVPEAGVPDKQALAAHRPRIERYLQERVSVQGDGKPCSPRAASRFGMHAPSDKLIVDMTYDCLGPVSDLEVRSTLFHDEDIPHQLLFDVRAGDAKKRFFLSKAATLVAVNLATLAAKKPSQETRDFRVATPPPGASMQPRNGQAKAPIATPAEPMASGFSEFLWQGVVHIFGGLDHVLFVVTLVLAIYGARQLLFVVTSFTLAHSITLALGALEVVVLPSRVVEPVIAASIIYVAAENLLRKEPRARVVVTFAFGLVHGFGFSSVLRDLGLPTGDLVPSLLGFNLGVEAGQLAIVAPLFPLVLWLRRGRAYRPASRVLNLAVIGVALYWLVERTWQW